jgi:hypothetical protein
MPDTKISALTAAASLADTDELVLASAGASKKITGANLKGSIPGSMALLSTTTLASAGTLDVSGISAAYNDLIVVVIARSSQTSDDYLKLSFNNDLAANYYSEYLLVAGTGGVAGAELSGSTGFRLGRVPGTTNLANSFASAEIMIPGYASTAWLKTVQIDGYTSLAQSTGNYHLFRGGGHWASTAAINRITVLGNATANLLTGSHMRIYGRL